MSDYRCSSCGRELPPGKCPKCNVYHDDLRPDGPLETCPTSSHEADKTAIALLRAWVAGCGDERFATKEQVKALIDASGDFLASQSDKQQP